MEVDPNLSSIKVEPIEIKSELEGELLVGITAQSTAGEQGFEGASESISGSDGLKTDSTKVKSEPEDELLGGNVGITTQILGVIKTEPTKLAGGQKFKKEKDNDSQGRPKEPEVRTAYFKFRDNQSEYYALDGDDNEGLVIKYTSGEGQSESESFEVVELSTLYNKSKKRMMIEEKDEPEFVKVPTSNFKFKRKNTFYKYCIVPLCTNTSVKTPHKMFIRVPANKNRRINWLRECGRNVGGISLKNTALYVCEDHFNIEEDMENYTRFKLMGGQKKMKPDVVPTIFDCQRDRRSSFLVPPRAAGVQKAKRKNIGYEIASTSIITTQSDSASVNRQSRAALNRASTTDY